MPSKPLDLADASKLELVSGKFQESYEAAKKRKRGNSLDRDHTAPEKKMTNSRKFIIN